MKKNSKKYARYEAMAVIPLFVFGGLIGYGVYKLGNFIHPLLSDPNDYQFLFLTDSISWTMPGILLAFGLIVIPLKFCYKLILKDEYDLYIEWTNKKHGYDGMKIMRPISFILTFIGLVSFGLLLNVSVKATDDAITVNRFFDVNGTTYPIKDIDKIVYYDESEAPNGDYNEDDITAFYIDENEIWRSDLAFLNDRRRRFDKFINRIAKINGLKIEEKGLYW